MTPAGVFCLALKDKVVGHTDESGVILPPLHPRCRCAIMYNEVAAPKLPKPQPTTSPSSLPTLPLTPAGAAVATEIISPPPKPTNENYRQETTELPYTPVSEERYNQLIIPLEKMGVTIHRGEEAERHLDFLGVEAVTIGTHDVLFRKHVSISAILEETYHIKQNRRGMNDDKDMPLRIALNEIDAKEYLLKVANKYGIPREEIEATKKQLAQYKNSLEEYYRRQGGS